MLENCVEIKRFSKLKWQDYNKQRIDRNKRYTALPNFMTALVVSTTSATDGITTWECLCHGHNTGWFVVILSMAQFCIFHGNNPRNIAHFSRFDSSDPATGSQAAENGCVIAMMLIEGISQGCRFDSCMYAYKWTMLSQRDSYHFAKGPLATLLQLRVSFQLVISKCNVPRYMYGALITINNVPSNMERDARKRANIVTNCYEWNMTAFISEHIKTQYSIMTDL